MGSLAADLNPASQERRGPPTGIIIKLYYLMRNKRPKNCKPFGVNHDFSIIYQIGDASSR